MSRRLDDTSFRPGAPIQQVARPLPASRLAPAAPRPIVLEPYRRCVVCGESDFTELVRRSEIDLELEFREELFRSLAEPATPGYMLKDQAFATQDYPARILECEFCGTLGRDPHLSERSAAEVYGADRYHPEWLERSFVEYRDAFAARMGSLVRWVGAQARVLEIGSFVGGFLSAANAAGWTAVGVDPGRCVSDFARGKGLDARIGTLRDMRFSDEAFDAAFAWCCFDQLPEPEKELREIERVLEGGGRLLIRVPNADFVRTTRALLDRLGGNEERAILRALAFSGLAGFPFQIGYSGAVLRDLLEDAGFYDVRVRNQINLRGGSSGRSSPWAIPEKARMLRRVHYWSQFAYYASFGRMLRGPWIEAGCIKRHRTIRCRAPHPVEDRPPRLRAFAPLPLLAS